MSMVEVKVPDIGDFKEVEVIELLVKPGDTVAVDQSLITVESDVWSAPSFNLLARDGADADRWNLLHPAEPARLPHITQCLAPTSGPIVVSTDYMRIFAEQVRAYIPSGRTYKVLGTDGFGRSDTRAKLREFFEVNRHFVVIAALKALADEGSLSVGVVTQAIEKYGINPNKPNPVLL